MISYQKFKTQNITTTKTKNQFKQLYWRDEFG